ncbi:PRC-barrel domain-containing protein [Chitinimonas sp. BJYL2]|uniref:PRC-barrel domain-containing protein n=1 Tax=Chitinimonas sp. BJYL2 TaxID=2976696 RepID=UPI0022B4EE9E|nr:PRC-barrel domain-containing protein [Chitinimonas sp. BJYL2]
MSTLQAFSNSPIKASSMIGTDVVNLKDEHIGDIKEIVIDPRSGRVAYAVVSFGGFFSLGEKLFAVPFNAFKRSEKGDDYVLDATKESMKDAPGFNTDSWPTMADEKWNRDVHQFYGKRPYWEN